MLNFTLSEFLGIGMVALVPVLAIHWVIRAARGVDGAARAWHQEWHAGSRTP